MSMFFGGVPTEPDVLKLLEAFPVIEPGQTIPYAEIEKILGIDRQVKMSRFRTVLTAWIKKVKVEKNFVLRTVRMTGIQRLTEVDRSVGNRMGWRRDQRRAGRKVRDMLLVHTPELTDTELRSHDHAKRVMLAHSEATAQSAKEIAAPAPVKALPKRTE